jgi:hypothetical protein
MSGSNFLPDLVIKLGLANQAKGEKCNAFVCLRLAFHVTSVLHF